NEVARRSQRPRRALPVHFISAAPTTTACSPVRQLRLVRLPSARSGYTDGTAVVAVHARPKPPHTGLSDMSAAVAYQDRKWHVARGPISDRQRDDTCSHVRSRERFSMPWTARLK